MCLLSVDVGVGSGPAEKYYIMKALLIVALLVLLLAQASAYAIEGTWQSIQHPNATITIAPVATDVDSLNQYALAVASCSLRNDFKIIDSFLKMLSLPQPLSATCSSAVAKTLLADLQEKMFFFEISNAELALVTVFGGKTLSFKRLDPLTPNWDLQGQFIDSA
jgi:hypothetical protein